MGNALVVHRHRGGLARTWERLAKGRLTVGFVGGSITDPRPRMNWPDYVVPWFVAKFPEARIVVENAAIGATGSDLAVFRAEHDLIGRGCDLVFIEFAVNDYGEPAERRCRTREGLIRKLLAGAGSDVVLAYTFGQPMYDDMMSDRVPQSIVDFEVLGEHYGLGSVWMGLHALNEVRAGRLRWEAWLPDGVHPQHLGSQRYADSVIAFLENELVRSRRQRGPLRQSLPPPYNPKNWEHAHLAPLDQLATTGPWALHRWNGCPWIDQVLATAAPGATATVEFRGRGLALGFDFGNQSSEFRYRLDGGEWRVSNRERYDWCGTEGWFRIFHVADDLPVKRHRFELEVTHPGEGKIGTNCRLAMVGVVS